MRQVIFSKIAQTNLDSLLEYLNFSFSETVFKKFILKLDKTIFLIQNEPEIFPISLKNKNLRKCVLSKQTIIFYSFNEDKISVFAFFDTRQNPQKINKLK